MQRVGTPVTSYPVVDAELAAGRASGVLAQMQETDEALNERLVEALSEYDAYARAIANEAYGLYWRMAGARTEQRRPLNLELLERVLILAMTRPEDDECWRDYQAVMFALGQHQVRMCRLTSWHSVRKLVRRGPSEARMNESLQPVIAAETHFKERWRAGSDDPSG